MPSDDDISPNKALIRNFRHRLWAERDLAVLDDVFAPDAVVRWGDAESDAVSAVRSDVERYFAGFSDVRSSIDELLAEDDKVVVRWTTTGQHTGPYGKVPPTGREVTMTGVDGYRIEGGRIVEAWSMWDALATYQQLGLVAPDVGP
jgi:predicted ester cyclase